MQTERTVYTIYVLRKSRHDAPHRSDIQPPQRRAQNGSRQLLVCHPRPSEASVYPQNAGAGHQHHRDDDDDTIATEVPSDVHFGCRMGFVLPGPIPEPPNLEIPRRFVGADAEKVSKPEDRASEIPEEELDYVAKVLRMNSNL